MNSNFTKKVSSLFVGLGLMALPSMAQVYTFTPASATGTTGPNQTQVTAAYAATTLAGQVTVAAGIQSWSVPASGLYKIEAIGAAGYGPLAGRGASMSGFFNLTAGSQLKILVGQKGGCCNGSGTNQYGGGGGSFVVTSTNTAMIVGGGGGGANGNSSLVTTADGSLTTSGNAGSGSVNGAAGTNGGGGGGASSAGGGGGFTGDGGATAGVPGGYAFLNGGVGGNAGTGSGGWGGFGGGGGANSYNNRRGGGGGGYSGGGGGGSSTGNAEVGGGGGSFNSGTNPVNLAGAGNGDGTVIITLVTPAVSSPNNVGVLAITSPASPFCPGTYPVTANVFNFGNNTVDSVKVALEVDGVFQSNNWYTVNIVPFGTGTYQATVNLGNVTFAPGAHNIKAWTSLPNNMVDPQAGNDTASLNGSTLLNGTYTINSALPTAGTNFESFSDFSDALTTQGVCGQVIANVITGSGPYVETAVFGNITGASAVNSIRINGNGETIQYNATSANRRIITLDGTNYLTIDNLKIKTLNSTYGWGLAITGTSSHDSITNCTVDLSTITGTSSANANGIVMSGSLTSATSTSSVTNMYIGNNTVIAGSTGSGGAYYGITFTGTSSANQNDSIIIVGNEVTNFYYYGIRLYYAKNSEVSKNNVHRITQTSIGTSAYGIYMYYSIGCKAIGNRVHDLAAPGVSSTSSFYGLYAYSYNNTAATPNLYANNAIYNLGNYKGSQYITYFYGPSSMIYNNSIDLSDIQGSSSSATYGMYVSINNNSEIKNNVINITGGNTGTKYGIRLASLSYSCDLQKNNVYLNSTQSGTQIPYYWGGNFASLAAFQTAFPTQEIGSASVPPQFLSPATGDLTPLSSSLINNGTNVYTLVPEDINGLPRSVTPTIGAFEFLPTGTNDAKSVVFISPSGQYCSGTATPVKVVIGNGGANSITSMTVNWNVNGVTQTPYNYTNTLVSPGSATGNSIDTITLGNVTLPSGSSDIVVWTSNPNNSIDLNHSNDTIFWASNSALPGGTYTINSGATPSATNFQSFSAFNTALSYGICGPIVANVVTGSGPYNETVEFLDILGSSAVNTVRINGNGEVLQYNCNTNNKNLFTLNGTKHFTLSNLKIKTLNSTYGWGVTITGDAMRDSILNCEIDLSNITGTSSVNANGIVMSGSNSSATTASAVSHITVRNNTVIAGSPTASGGGYYGIVFNGGGSTTPNDSIYIIGNEVTNFYYYGIRAAYVNGGDISYNNVHRSSKTSIGTSCYAIYTYYSRGIKVEGNKVHDLAAPGVHSTSTRYGIYSYHYNNTAATPILVANNIIYNMGNYSGTQYNMYCYGPYQNVYHNTVDVSALQSNASSTSYGIYFGVNTGSEFKNNIINVTGGNTGTKYGFYRSGSTAADLQKNNVNMASSQSGTQTAYSFGGNYATLAAFQAANPTLEIGSPSVAPQFISATSGDLSPLNMALMTSGVNLTADVPLDITGATRSTTPTIGAFEFAVLGNNNARPLALTSPSGNFCSGQVPVKVMIGNVGLNNITNLQIHWTVNGVTQTTVAYTDTLVPIGSTQGQSFDTVLLGNAIVNSGNNTFKVWTSLPNGVADSHPANDTLNEIVIPASFSVTASASPICANNQSVLSLSPSSGYPAGGLQWQSSNDGGLTWTNIPNTDTVKYVVTNISQNMTYRVHILSSGNDCFTPSATVDVNFVTPPTVIGAESCYPDSLTIYATPSTGNTLKWYENVNTATVYSTSSALTTPPLFQTKTYYAVSQSSNGCQSVRTPVSAVIHELPPVNLGYDNDTCVSSGTVVVLDPGTQHPGATYLWDNGTTGTTRSISQSGTYSVVVTDTNTCFFGDTIVVNLKPNPELDLNADGTSFCIGTSKTLDAGPDGQNGGSYYWNTGQVTQTIDVNTAGTYWVYVTTDLGCTATDTIIIVEDGYAPTFDGIHSVAQGSATFSFEAINPQNVAVYAWDFGDGTTSTQANPIHTYASNGIYMVKLTVNSTCADANDSASVNIIGLGVNDPTLDAKLISVYPNPNHNGQLTVELKGDLTVKSMTLINVLGQVQQSWNSFAEGQDKIQILLPASGNGIYQLMIETNKGRTIRKIELMK